MDYSFWCLSKTGTWALPKFAIKGTLPYNRYVSNMEAQSPKVDLRTTLTLSHKMIFHIGHLPLLESGELNPGWYCTQ